MAELELAGSTLRIRVKGLLNKAQASFDAVPLEIPLAHITNVHVGRSTPPPPDSSSPSWFFGKQKSWEWSSGGKDKGLHSVNEFVEQGLLVNDPYKVIEISLTNESFTRLVLRANDPAATAAWIMAAVQAYKS